jgi:hypothetical protein
MGEAERAPWSLRSAERPGGSPLRLALAAFVALTLLFFALELLLGRFPVFAREPHVTPDFRLALVLIGSSPARRSCGRTRATTLRSLLLPGPRPGSGVACRRDGPAPHATAHASASRALRCSCSCPGDGPHAETCAVAAHARGHHASPPMGPLAGSWRLTTVMDRVTPAAALGAVRSIDLLDLHPLAPLASAGLRHTLIGAGQISFLLIVFR